MDSRWVPRTLAGALLMAACAWGSGVTAEAAPAPQLSIGVDNGRTSATAGDTLTYVVTVRNLGTDAVKGLAVTQNAPSGLKVESVDPAGTVGASGPEWTVDLDVGAEAVFHSTMTVSPTSPELMRLATVACAALSGGQPIVCASHSDQLPAGAARDALSSPAVPASGGFGWWLTGGGLVLALVAGLLVLVARRRKTL